MDDQIIRGAMGVTTSPIRDGLIFVVAGSFLLYVGVLVTDGASSLGGEALMFWLGALVCLPTGLYLLLYRTGFFIDRGDDTVILWRGVLVPMQTTAVYRLSDFQSLGVNHLAGSQRIKDSYRVELQGHPEGETVVLDASVSRAEAQQMVEHYAGLLDVCMFGAGPVPDPPWEDDGDNPAS